MDKRVDDFIKYSIDQTLGIDVPKEALQMKIEALEKSNYILRGQYLATASAVQRATEEAGMKARDLKKYVEENQKFVSKCSYLENECFLYEQDQKTSMDEKEILNERIMELEEQLKELKEQLKKTSEERENSRNMKGKETEAFNIILP